MFPENVQHYIGYTHCYWLAGIEQISPDCTIVTTMHSAKLVLKLKTINSFRSRNLESHVSSQIDIKVNFDMQRVI